jgi:hypothetical protein
MITLQARHVAQFVKGVLITLAVAMLGYWMWYSYKTRVEVEMVKTRVATLNREFDVAYKSVQDQLDTFYRTLYTEVEQKPVTPPAKPVPPRQPSTVELWQRNRDKELRDRIRVMEQWRQRMEQQLRELR